MTKIKRAVWHLTKSIRILTKTKDIKTALTTDISCKLPKSIHLRHSGIGIVIAKNVKLEEDITIYPHVLIGGKDGKYPTVQHHATIHGGTSIIGDVTIGHHSIIGCNSVVLKDIPPYSVAAGNPAKIIKKADRGKGKNIGRYVNSSK